MFVLSMSECKSLAKHKKLANIMFMVSALLFDNRKEWGDKR